MSFLLGKLKLSSPAPARDEQPAAKASPAPTKPRDEAPPPAAPQSTAPAPAPATATPAPGPSQGRVTRQAAARGAPQKGAEAQAERAAAPPVPRFAEAPSTQAKVTRKAPAPATKEKAAPKRTSKAIVPAAAPSPTPAPSPAEPARVDPIRKSVKRATSSMNRGKKTEAQMSAPDKPEAEMTIREVIKRSMEAQRLESRKRARVEASAAASASKPGPSQPQATPVPASDPSTSTPNKSKQKEGEIAPQVEVVDGEIVINRESLSIKAQAQTLMNPERRVEETGSKLSAFTYARYLTPTKWKPDETELFYQALRQFGMDFGLIQKLFPGRARKQIKSKFQREEKQNPGKIDEALKSYESADCVDHYKQMVELLQQSQRDAEAQAS